ncbi:DNA polymerase/3'-5' exonuclease PolX [Clostridium formicaceticum]|uniref:DNA polymerase beta n=1 Tax=Clostridium formicaceticum TaxID=1497 RepID=A0AAC9RJ79_9CLOT|nr:DNA polymerase/3'-5' exonuclease PolX [Clostridium formicaceticum]AOY76633.1 histidinol-phosphatase [Clostridium formicaceticum]ARE87056.1 DNA polymerase/3'-5' exonuclease PolX [Clostridium formicaceticum]
MDKKEVSKILEEIGILLEIQGENPFKTRAYFNGARTIELLKEDISILVEENRLGEVKGIGKALQEKISELVRTGRLAYYEELKSQLPEGIFDLLKIPGLGPKKVKLLYSELAIKNLGELEYACLENRLLHLKGFGEKTQNKILEGIDHLKKYRGQHLLSTGILFSRPILEKLQKNQAIIGVSLAGSIRRQKELIKDIDIIASCQEEKREAIMEEFTSFSEVEKIIAKGNTKSSVLLSSGVNIDLRLVEEEEYPTALHHFTGSKEHNTAIRHRAKTLGLKVNEYGIFRGDEKIKVEDEEDFFQTLRLQYIPPELRENNGEIEAAEAGDIPTLVDLEDIKGIFHVHSNYSDGINTLEELIKAAIDKGFQYIGISDHSKTAVYANGLKEAAVKKQHEEIQQLRIKYPQIKIFKGIESDILPDGSLDYGEEVLSQFDYIIGSIHSHFNMDRESMTNRIKRAVENKYLTILGHPTGRLLLSRKAYDVDLEAIIEACSANAVAIEINSNPHRLDLDWRMCKYAKEKGVKLVIEPDAHRISGFDDIAYGIGIARKGWLGAEDVLNCREAEEVEMLFKK